jgi:ArsR family transcriptional regulator, lead/cadmium/zinc/bismuth-responsive transcriptional repressor
MRERTQPSAEMCEAQCIHEDDVARARSIVAGDATYRELSALFAALADPTRAKIVHILLNQELCTCDIAAVVGVTDSAVSQHLRILRSLRLVKSRRAGKFVYYSLDDAHIALLVQLGLTHQGHHEDVGTRTLDTVLKTAGESA